MRKLVYERDDDVSGTAVVGGDGAVSRSIPNFAWETALSPDGRWSAFVSDRGGDEVCRRELDATLTMVAGYSKAAASAAVSP